MVEDRAQEKRYTYGDYRLWDDGLRWELIDGAAFCMSPGPGATHQTLLGDLFFSLKNYFQGKTCRVYVAPFDVLLPDDDESEDEIDTVVQPDIMILCDKSRLHSYGIKGAPDVVFEILSPSTARRDLTAKLRLYERVGVEEYVIVDPGEQVMTAYRRGEDGLLSKRTAYGMNDILELDLFPDLKIPLKPIWENVPFSETQTGEGQKPPSGASRHLP